MTINIWSVKVEYNKNKDRISVVIESGPNADEVFTGSVDGDEVEPQYYREYDGEDNVRHEEEIEHFPGEIWDVLREHDLKQRMSDDIHCPMCGEMIYQNVTVNDFDTLGRNCPNYCGWIEPEMQGEDLHIKVCPTTY